MNINKLRAIAKIQLFMNLLSFVGFATATIQQAMQNNWYVAAIWVVGACISAMLYKYSYNSHEMAVEIEVQQHRPTAS